MWILKNIALYVIKQPYTPLLSNSVLYRPYNNIESCATVLSKLCANKKPFSSWKIADAIIQKQTAAKFSSQYNIVLVKKLNPQGRLTNIMENARTTWVELPGKWFQKAFYNNVGTVIFSYHYGAKIKPAAKFFEIDSHKSKQLCSYKLIEKDLRDVRIFLNEYDRLLKSHSGKFKGPNNTPTEGILAKALLSAITIHYFRCFPGGYGRTAHLQEQSISESNQQTHNFLKALRNQYIAHSDESDFESCKSVFLIPPEKASHRHEQFAGLSFELKQAYGAEMFANDISLLLDELVAGVNAKIESLSNNIINEIMRIPHDKIYGLLKRSKGNRVIITQQIINSLLNT